MRNPLNIDWKKEMDNFILEYSEIGLDYGSNADDYFIFFREKYNLHKNHDPFIQITTYKEFLEILQDTYPFEYKEIHKGTPFYWIGWYSFLAEYYDQAVFYIDAAMSEDKKKHPPELWPDSGAAMFFRLKLTNYQLLFRSSTAPELEDVLKQEFKRFNRLNLKNNITIGNFVEKFVEKVIYNDNTAIITTLYTFILEKDTIMEMIHNRGKYGGTIEPMIVHLFKGSLIFETLLKEHYGGNTLGDTLHRCRSAYSFDFAQCKPNSIRDIFSYNHRNKKQTAFCITYKLRNKTAHNLNWDDLFTESNYEKVYYNILNAIFYVIQEEYL